MAAIKLPPELWIRIALAIGQDTDEHTFNSLARAIPSLGRWTIGTRGVGLRLDLMLMFGYSVEFESRKVGLSWAKRTYKYTNWTKNGRSHRNDQPAVTSDMGDIYRETVDDSYYRGWFYHGKMHRIDGPAIESIDLYFAWYRHGSSYRCNGPSKTYDDVYVLWRWGDYDYRERGPVHISSCGNIYWSIGRLFHRTDGPAVIRGDGTTEHWIRGKRSLFIGRLEAHVGHNSRGPIVVYKQN